MVLPILEFAAAWGRNRSNPIPHRRRPALLGAGAAYLGLLAFFAMARDDFFAAGKAISLQPPAAFFSPQCDPCVAPGLRENGAPFCPVPRRSFAVSPSSLPRIRALVLAAAAASASATLSGCILPLAAAGAGAAGGYSVFGQERAPGQQIDDTVIRTLVSQSWDQFNPDLAHDLDATVYQARVLITGRVPSEEWRQEAVQRTWKVDGVKEVYDEIEVGPDTHFSDEARDTIISTRLRNDLLFDSSVKSINYTVKTEDGVVYIIGSARSQEELDRVTDYARNIANVRRVVSYVKIRSGEPAPAQTGGASAPAASASAPAATPAAASEPATSRAQIEVTPLK
jgi:osmotically-inducible protein OsmY